MGYDHRIAGAASVYRWLKAQSLFASPAFIVIKASDAFKDKTTAPSLSTDVRNWTPV